MPIFSRRTILAALDTLESRLHSKIDWYLLKYGLEHVAMESGGSKQKRVALVAKYLLQEPEQLDEDGRNLIDAIVEERVVSAIDACASCNDGFYYEDFQKGYPDLHRGLERDGFTVEDGHLRKALPEVLDLLRQTMRSTLSSIHTASPRREGISIRQSQHTCTGTGRLPTHNFVHSLRDSWMK